MSAADEIRAMIDLGMTAVEIAEARGVSRQAVHDMCRRNGLTPPKVVRRKAKQKATSQCEYCGKSINGTRKFCSRDCRRYGRRSARTVPNIKLDEEAAKKIKARRKNGETFAAIAADYGVSIGLIQAIEDGRAWARNKGHWPKGKRRSDCDASEWDELIERVADAMRRGRKGIASMRALARMVGVDAKTVSRWMSGERYPMQSSVDSIKEWLE